jgi:acetyl esterase/lipase
MPMKGIDRMPRPPELDRVLKAQAAYGMALADAEGLDDLRRLDAAVIPSWSGPLAGDVQRRRLDAGGVAAVTSTPPGAIRGRVLMYLHGGGFVLGSPEAAVTPAARAARVAHARALLPRFLPEAQRALARVGRFVEEHTLGERR